MFREEIYINLKNSKPTTAKLKLSSTQNIYTGEQTTRHPHISQAYRRSEWIPHTDYCNNSHIIAVPKLLT